MRAWHVLDTRQTHLLAVEHHRPPFYAQVSESEVVGERIAARNLEREVVEIRMIEVPRLWILNLYRGGELLVGLFLREAHGSIIHRRARLTVPYRQMALHGFLGIVPETYIEAGSAAVCGRVRLWSHMHISDCLLTTHMKSYAAIDTPVVAPVERALVGQLLVAIGI